MFLGISFAAIATAVGGYLARRVLTSRTFVKQASRLVFTRVVDKLGMDDKVAAHRAFMRMLTAGARAILTPMSLSDERLATTVFDLLWDERGRGKMAAVQVELGKAASRLHKFAVELARMPDPMGRMP